MEEEFFKSSGFQLNFKVLPSDFTCLDTFTHVPQSVLSVLSLRHRDLITNHGVFMCLSFTVSFNLCDTEHEKLLNTATASIMTVSSQNWKLSKLVQWHNVTFQTLIHQLLWLLLHF